MTPARIQLSRKKGYRKPADAVVVARPSRWGNPFRVESVGRGAQRHWIVVGGVRPQWAAVHHSSSAAAAAEAVALFRDSWTQGFRGSVPSRRVQLRSDLAGRDLACWCPLDQPCHADVLLDIANGSNS